MTIEEARSGSIILLAKRAGDTSFSSLYLVKRALGTAKVGHTGTLDSFATGLLVVCAGQYTKLVKYITQSDKTYESIIEFGKETDTLDWTGKTVYTAPLPSIERVKAALERFTGKIVQCPPQFSAIHIGGKRASDIARSGEKAVIPEREVEVYSSILEEVMLATGEKANTPLIHSLDTGVLAIKARFTVSKGTYIRALARDIGKECGSAASLAALRRTMVGNFSLEDAALYSTLNPFTLESAFSVDDDGRRTGEAAREVDDKRAVEEILEKAMPLTLETAKSYSLPPQFIARFVR